MSKDQTLHITIKKCKSTTRKKGRLQFVKKTEELYSEDNYVNCLLLVGDNLATIPARPFFFQSLKNTIMKNIIITIIGLLISCISAFGLFGPSDIEFLTPFVYTIICTSFFFIGILGSYIAITADHNKKEIEKLTLTSSIVDRLFMEHSQLKSNYAKKTTKNIYDKNKEIDSLKKTIEAARLEADKNHEIKSVLNTEIKTREEEIKRLSVSINTHKGNYTRLKNKYNALKNS